MSHLTLVISHANIFGFMQINIFQVKIGFTVKANDTASASGSVSDLTKKARGSISSLNKVAGNLGGSLLSLGGKEKKNLARLASAVSGKVEKVILSSDWLIVSNTHF